MPDPREGTAAPVTSLEERHMTVLRLPRRGSRPAHAVRRLTRRVRHADRAPGTGWRADRAWIRALERAGRTIRLHDGRELGFAEFGDPAGRPVLFFHGFGSSRLVRHPDDTIATSLGLRMIAVDRPGIGLSSPKPGRSLLDWPADVLELADRLGLERFGILAWSGGSPYALACAYLLPDRVEVCGLVSGPAPLAGVPGADYLRGYHRSAARAATRAPWMVRIAMWRLGRAQRRDPEGHLEEAVARMVDADRQVMSDPALRAVMIRNIAEVYRHGGRGLYDDALVLARPWGFRLEDISVPVRLWHGELDPTVPPQMGRHVARAIPGCDARFFPGEGHHLLYERWREILGSIAA